MPNGLTLHEAIVAIMMRERRFTMTNVELSSKNETLQLKPQTNGGWPDAAQVFLRAKNYPQFFELQGDARLATFAFAVLATHPRAQRAGIPTARGGARTLHVH